MVRTPCCDKTGMKKGTWTPEEDRKLMAYVTRYGCWNWRQLPKWSAIAAQLPGRTDNEIKNHWHTNLKKRLKQNSVSGDQAEDHQNPDHNSHSKTKSQERESKPNTIQVTESTKQPQTLDINPISTPPILESSTASSPQPCSSPDHQVSSITTDMNRIAFVEPYAEPSGNDFWTEPFLSDNSYNFNISYNDFLAPLIDPGYESLHSPFLDGEILCPYGLY
ncbi:hypothetical protein JRO89_XS01G0159400 [Xanthoceras sorbifolium]|uniref:Uncharacterized protein n=1 Tax=Xanthoceras sorbifolium TaxID=99658 RepID=A0ABQ8IJK7_9ROSI|nr:hypothetical protein JRO89_XS01G0159400 [Xanthoceras sorbifolium]